LARPRFDFKQTTVYFARFSQIVDNESSVRKGPALKTTQLQTGAARPETRANKRQRQDAVKLAGRAVPAPTAERKPVAPKASLSVRERILLVAERLFAEHGMSGVGLRAITAEAEVNLASIAYHFGSKEGLLEELFALRAAPIAQERLRLLARCREGNKTPALEDILDAFLRPALTLGAQPQFGGPAFVKLRARLATEPETLARKILSKAFDQSSKAFIDAIAQALPRLARAEVEWRFHFMLGAMFYTMANSGRIQALTDGRCDPGNVKRALHHMIPFLAAGFRSAPVSAPSK
jgi:AcrR family transcriptional regulator